MKNKIVSIGIAALIILTLFSAIPTATAAPTKNLFDSFEAPTGFGNWTSIVGTAYLSNNYSHGGTNAVHINRTGATVAVYENTTTADNIIMAGAWIYLDATVDQGGQLLWITAGTGGTKDQATINMNKTSGTIEISTIDGGTEWTNNTHIKPAPNTWFHVGLYGDNTNNKVIYYYNGSAIEGKDLAIDTTFQQVKWGCGSNRPSMAWSDYYVDDITIYTGSDLPRIGGGMDRNLTWIMGIDSYSASHPYANSTLEIQLGTPSHDTIGAGQNLSVMAHLCKNQTITSVGIGGRTADTARSEYARDFEDQTSQGKIILAGNNDIGGGTQTGAEVLADIIAMSNWAIANGSKVIISTIMPPAGNWDAAKKAQANITNVGIRNYVNSTADAYLVDTHAYFVNPASFDRKAGYDEGPGGNHLNVQGYLEWAALIQWSIDNVSFAPATPTPGISTNLSQDIIETLIVWVPLVFILFVVGFLFMFVGTKFD